jgi:pimeloyl-ACP methyl ester carboxylesterase
MNRLTRDGMTLAFKEVGRGTPPIIFVHGAFGDHTQFDQQAKYFEQRHRVLTFDCRGHGRSSAPIRGYTILDFAEDVIWLSYELGIKKPVIVGHSMGGSISVELAATFPDFPSAIIALDAPILIPQATRSRMRHANESLAPPQLKERVIRSMSEGFLSTDDSARKHRVLSAMEAIPAHVFKSVWEEGLLQWDGFTAIKKCNIPFMYVSHGSPNCDLNLLQELQPQLIMGRTVGAGHWAMMEIPDQVNAMLSRFIQLVGN